MNMYEVMFVIITVAVVIIALIEVIDFIRRAKMARKDDVKMDHLIELADTAVEKFIDLCEDTYERIERVETDEDEVKLKFGDED